MRSPATAMLWESWRLTRWTSTAVILVASIGGWAGLAAWGDDPRTAGVTILLTTILAVVQGFVWGSDIDDRGGFPFVLGYVRPTPTWLLVGVPMAYVGVSCALSYLVPMTILRAAFGIPFPLAPVAGSIVAMSLVLTACNWWTGDKTRRQAVGLAAFVVGVAAYEMVGGLDRRGPLFPQESWSELFGFSAADYGLLGLITAAAIGATILGVERQRRGDELVAPKRDETDSLRTTRSWLIDWVRAPCPTSSPTRAQLWFEARSVGGPVLVSGVLTALAVPVVLWVMITFESDTGMVLVMAAPLVPLIIGFRSIFRIRRKQGHSFLSTFDATLALGTLRLVGLKVLVTVLSIIGALGAIGISFWFSLGLIPGGEDARAVIGGALGGLSGYRLSTISLLALIHFSAVVAYQASIQVFLVLHPKRLTLGAFGLALYLLAIVLADSGDGVAPFFVEANFWVVAMGIPLGTVYVFRKALADRVLTRRQAGTAVFIWAGLAVVYLVLLRDLGTFGSGTVLVSTVALLISLSLLPLAAVAVAPLSFALLRHS